MWGTFSILYVKILIYQYFYLCHFPIWSQKFLQQSHFLLCTLLIKSLSIENGLYTLRFFPEDNVDICIKRTARQNQLKKGFYAPFHRSLKLSYPYYFLQFWSYRSVKVLKLRPFIPQVYLTINYKLKRVQLFWRVVP